MKRAALLVVAMPLVALARQPDPVQRAVIERDRQSAEFARPELRDLHLRRDVQHLPARPDERTLEERERDAQSPAIEKPASTPDYTPLPLPGGARHGVDPIPVQRGGG
ncbi:MAG TPA: hypothetical protein VE085_14570 [Burkholderiales bacterium]|nr:hypothetical protein [Burkholderiales bacterium]